MFDLIIKNGWILDGLGTPKYRADIGITSDRITKIGNLTPNDDDKEKIIEAKNLYVCPGFIDPHAHFDLSLDLFPECENGLIQGITSFVGGNCGMSSILIPAKDIEFPVLLSHFETMNIGVNFIPLIGHGFIRSKVMGEDYKRAATPDEIQKMKSIVEEAMEIGAFGFSTGLDYNPTMHSDTHEIIELAKSVSKYGGIYATHHRFLQSKWPAKNSDQIGYANYPGDIDEVWMGRYHGLMEAIEIGKKAKIPVQISHLYNVYRTPQPHSEFLDIATAKATLALIDQALEEGVDISFDRMVTHLDILGYKPIINDFLFAENPNLAKIQKKGKAQFLEDLTKSEFRNQIKNLSAEGNLKFLYFNTRADPFWMDRIKIVRCNKSEIVGKKIGEIARNENKDPLDVIFDIILIDEKAEYMQCMDEKEITEANLEIYLCHPKCMPATDVISFPSLKVPVSEIEQRVKDYFIQNINSPHTYSMYPYFIGTYIRDKKIMPLEEAIKKSTSQVAERYGIRDRGVIKPNFYADLLIFDFKTINRVATYENPRQAPKGIKYVFVNGSLAMKENQQQAKRTGRVLRKNSHT